MPKKTRQSQGTILGPYSLYNLDGSQRTPSLMNVGLGTHQNPLDTQLAAGFVNFWFMPTDEQALQIVLTRADAMALGAEIERIATKAQIDVKGKKASSGKSKADKASKTKAKDKKKTKKKNKKKKKK